MHDLCRHIRSRIRMYLVAGTVFSAVLPLPVHAFNVIVITSAELKPYEDALRGFRDACNCDVEALRMEDYEGGVELLRKSPNAVVAIGTSAFKKVRTIKDLPVVYTMVIPSETAGALAPNISGVSMDIAPAAYIAAMKEVFPGARRIGLVYDPRNTRAFVEEALKSAASSGLELFATAVKTPSAAAAGIDGMRGRIDIFWMVPDPTVVTAETVDYLLRFSFQQNVPVFSFSRKYVEMGAVAALDVDPYDMGSQTGEMVGNLSEGRTGSHFEWARSAHLTLNEKVAAKMGIKINREIKKVRNGE
jgi:putative ABC transport system substrate-binding protein